MTVEVTQMPDAEVEVLRSKFAAAGMGLVMYDDRPNPRPGTLPLAARKMDDDFNESLP